MREGGCWPMETRHFSLSLPDHCFSLLSQPQRLRPWRAATLPTMTSPPLIPPNLKPISHSRSSCSISCRRWNSNAKTIRSQGSKFNFKGRDNKNDQEEDYEGDEDEDENEYTYGATTKKRRWWSNKSIDVDEGPGWTSEEAIDNFWVFKVLSSYGWMLPIIIISWLTASGPKAILMALALPLGQSALSQAFEKLWGKAESKRKRRSTVRRKSSARSSSGVGEKEEYEKQDMRKRKKGYQSWVVRNDDTVGMGRKNAPKFGGWEELDKFGSTSRSSPVADEARRKSMDKGKLSRKNFKSDTPFLLRLLIAVFPFLGSWTKML